MSLHLMGLFCISFFFPFSLVKSYELQTRMSLELSSQHSTPAEKIKLKCLLLYIKRKSGQRYLGNLVVFGLPTTILAGCLSFGLGPCWVPLGLLTALVSDRLTTGHWFAVTVRDFLPILGEVRGCG